MPARQLHRADRAGASWTVAAHPMQRQFEFSFPPSGPSQPQHRHFVPQPVQTLQSQPGAPTVRHQMRQIPVQIQRRPAPVAAATRIGSSSSHQLQCSSSSLQTATKPPFTNVPLRQRPQFQFQPFAPPPAPLTPPPPPPVYSYPVRGPSPEPLYQIQYGGLSHGAAAAVATRTTTVEYLHHDGTVAFERTRTSTTMPGPFKQFATRGRRPGVPGRSHMHAGTRVSHAPIPGRSNHHRLAICPPEPVYDLTSSSSSSDDELEVRKRKRAPTTMTTTTTTTTMMDNRPYAEPPQDIQEFQLEYLDAFDEEVQHASPVPGPDSPTSPCYQPVSPPVSLAAHAGQANGQAAAATATTAANGNAKAATTTSQKPASWVYRSPSPKLLPDMPPLKRRRVEQPQPQPQPQHHSQNHPQSHSQQQSQLQSHVSVPQPVPHQSQQFVQHPSQPQPQNLPHPSQFDHLAYEIPQEDVNVIITAQNYPQAQAQVQPQTAPSQPRPAHFPPPPPLPTRGVGKLVPVRAEDWPGAHGVQPPATPSMSSSSVASASTSAGVFLPPPPPPLPGSEMGPPAPPSASGVVLPSPSTFVYPPSPPWAHKAQVHPQPNGVRIKQEPQELSTPALGLSMSYAHSPVKMEDGSGSQGWFVKKEEPVSPLGFFGTGTAAMSTEDQQMQVQGFIPGYFDVHPQVHTHPLHPLHPGWEGGFQQNMGMGMDLDVDVNVQIGSGVDREDVHAYLMQEQMQMQHQHQHQHQHLQLQPQPQPVVNTIPAIPSSQAAVSAVIANFQRPPAQPHSHPQNVGQAQQQLPQAQLPRHQQVHQVQQAQRPEPIDVDRLPSTQAPVPSSSQAPSSQAPPSQPSLQAQAPGERGERTLVTSGCRAFALPAKCLEGYPGFTLNRQEFVGKKVRKLESRGLRKVRSWIEEDTHLIIEWQSSIPVWSDTLQPEIPDLAAAIRMVTSHNSMVASAGAGAKAGAGSSGEAPNKRARSSTGQSQGQRRSSSIVGAAEAGASGSQAQAQSQGQGQPPSQVRSQSQAAQSQTKKRRRESATVPVQSSAAPPPQPGPSSTGHAQGGPSSSSASTSTSRANSAPHISTPSAPTSKSTSAPNTTPTSNSAPASTPIRLPTLGTFSIPSSIPIPLPSPSKVPGQGAGIFKVQTSNDPASQAGADGMLGTTQTQSQPERRVVPDDELFTGTQHGKKVDGTRAKTPAILRRPRSESASVTPTASLKRKADSVEMGGDGGRDRSASRMPPPLPTPTPESAGGASSSMLTGHRSMPSVVSTSSASSSTPTPKSMSQPRSQLRTTGNPYPVIPPNPDANVKPSQSRPPLPGRSRLPLPGRGPKILQGPPPSQSQSQVVSQGLTEKPLQSSTPTSDRKEDRPRPLDPSAPVLATPNPTPSPKRASITQMPGQAPAQAQAVKVQPQPDLPVAFSPRHKRHSTPSASESASALLEQSLRKPASVPASFRDAIGASASPAAAAAATTTAVKVASPGAASAFGSAFGSVLADAVSSFPVPKADGASTTSPRPPAAVEASSLLPPLPVTEREDVQDDVTQPAVGGGAGSDVRGEEEEQKRGHSSDGDDVAVASALLLASPEGSSSSRGGHDVLPGVLEGAETGDGAQAGGEGGQDAVVMGHGHDRDVDVAMEDAVDGEMDEDDDADDSSSGGEVGMLVIEFLQRYCQLFDADRSKLADAYAPNALFSCRRHDLASASTASSTSMPVIAQGRSEIIEKLLTLGAYAFCPRGIPRNLQFDAVVVDPPSDSSSSSSDPAAQGALSIKNLGQGDILLTVHGEIALPHEGGPEQDHVLALDQSLLLRRPPAPDGGAQRGEGKGSGDAPEGLELEDPKEPWPLLAISHQMTVRAALLLDAERLEEEEPWMQDILA